MRDTAESQNLTTADLANTIRLHDRREAVITETARPGRNEGGDQVTGHLLASDLSRDMQARWEIIQTEFVDNPQVSVQRADELVALAIKKLAETFADERARLEHQWTRGNDVSTEDLRQALRRYRSFFQRLLAM